MHDRENKNTEKGNKQQRDMVLLFPSRNMVFRIFKIVFISKDSFLTRAVGVKANRFLYLADNTKICYTYDNLSRVTKRTVYNECNEIVSEENFTYDAAGNITDAPNSCFIYDTNNRLIVFNGNTVSYDMDGNMLSSGYINCEFDSANRLLKAGGHTYTYNAEDVRIRNLCSDADTTYTYNTNCKLSQLLTKTTNGITTKYVYGNGLIGEEKCGEFKTYHFDFRGSTVAITNATGEITDTFKYDTYGNLTERTGDSFVIFGYNGRDGVVTDKNGLIYMRARYYSPAMRRFINADILHGQISDSTSLNRYSYVNGNPVSFVDPFGLEKERGSSVSEQSYWVDEYDAFYVTRYSLDIVGHSRVYLKVDEGQWILTEFTGPGLNKKKAKVKVKDITSEELIEALSEKLEELPKLHMESKRINPYSFDSAFSLDIDESPNIVKLYNEGVQYIPIKGDFSESIRLARDVYKGKNLGGYILFTNNCLHYAKKILKAGDIEDPGIDFVVNYSSTIIPKMFYDELNFFTSCW